MNSDHDTRARVVIDNKPADVTCPGGLVGCLCCRRTDRARDAYQRERDNADRYCRIIDEARTAMSLMLLHGDDASKRKMFDWLERYQ